MSKVVNMLGARFGSLVVSEFAYIKNRNAFWACKCDCGNTRVVNGKSLRNGNTKSCGCLRKLKGIEFGERRRRENKYYSKDSFLHVILSSKHEFICDKEDLSYVVSASWHETEDGYARGCVNGKDVYFHNLIMGNLYEDKMLCDHINGDRKDNRKCNLRLVTHQQNSYNTKIYSNNTSGYTGVKKSKNKKKWTAYITKDKTYYLGTFETKEEAIMARCNAEEKLFGEYRRIDAS